MTDRPLIAITPDSTPARADESVEDEYRLRVNYADAIEAAGGTPIILAYQAAVVRQIAETFDGFLITGGTPGVFETARRTAFERNLIEVVLEREKPILGICNGMQLIGQTLGAWLVDDLEARGRGRCDHIPFPNAGRVAHRIDLKAGSRLASWSEASSQVVNSLHRHSITEGTGFEVVARSEDGTVEAFEAKEQPFCIGVQWHPEYALTDLDRTIFANFVRATDRSAD